MFAVLGSRQPMAKWQGEQHEKDCSRRAASVWQELCARRAEAGHSRDSRQRGVSVCDHRLPRRRRFVVPGNCEQRPRAGGGVQGGLQGQVHAGVREAGCGLRPQLLARADSRGHWRYHLR